MIKSLPLRILFSSLFLGLVTSLSAQDVTPPVFDSYEPELALECSDVEGIYVTATDDSGEDVVITYSDASFSGGCTDNRVRTYTALDSSGNTTSIMQILVIVDETPPVFLGVGEDMTISCDEAIPAIPAIPVVIVYDECTELEIEEFDFETSFEDGICSQIIRWTWSATDECGNYGEYTKTITIEDNDAPVFSEELVDYYIGCEEEYPSAPIVTADDNCTDVTVSYEEEIISGGVGEGASSHCTAQDVSYLNNSFSMKLINSPAQENYITSDLVLMQSPDMGEGSTAVLSGNLYGEDNPNAGWYVYMEFDNGMDWDAWSTQDFPTGYRDDFDIATESHLDWVYFIMNSSNSYFMGLGDYEGSELQLSHMPANYYYGFQLGFGASNFTSDYGMSGWFLAEGTFYDAGSPDEEAQNGVEFSYAGDIYTDFLCCPIESLVRTWTAEDQCENISQMQQTITKIDILAPNFTFVPEDLLIECSDELPTEMAEATDNCGEPVVTFEDVTVPTECPSEYTIYRTFTATDICGLNTSVTQIITVTDTEIPVFSPFPEDVVIDCEDDLPAAPEVTAFDACDGELTVEFSEEIIGDQGPEGAEAYCYATTPVNTDLGWAGILFDAVLGDILVTATEVNYVQYPDQGEGAYAEISGSLQSMTNENAGWTLEMSLMNGMNWEDWSSQTFPTDYKDGPGTSEEYYESWMYFILESGTLTGYGDWEGTSISLSHAPVNYYYGFQLGVQAANLNEEYGVGGWVSYAGTMYNEEGEIAEINGGGDFAFDLDCCPRYSVERSWSVTDCAGNTSEHQQLITFEDLTEEEETPAIQVPEDEFSLAGAFIEDILKVGVSPNPVTSTSEIVLSSEVNIQAGLKLYTTQGLLVRSIWSGLLDKESDTEILFKKEGLNAGLYILKLNTMAGEITSKILIEE
jgi:hypothetical protein